MSMKEDRAREGKKAKYRKIGLGPAMDRGDIDFGDKHPLTKKRLKNFKKKKNPMADERFYQTAKKRLMGSGISANKIGKYNDTPNKFDASRIAKKAGGGMSSGQAAIAAKAPPPNKIDAKDFAVLRKEKARGRGMGLQDESVKPGKVMKADMGKFIGKLTKPIRRLFGKGTKTAASGMNQPNSVGLGKMLPDLLQKAVDDGTIKTAKHGKMMKYKRGSGLDLPVINSVKPTVNKTKRAQNLSRMKIQFTKQKNRAGAYAKKIGLPKPLVTSEKFKNVGKFPYVSMAEMRKAKGFKPGESASEFNKRRKILAGVTKAASATKVGKIALGIGAVGLGAKKYLESKMKKKEVKKKMSGGMMKPMGYTKGGGMDTGRVGEMKSRVTLAVDRLKKAKKSMGRGTGRLTDNDMEKIKSLVGKGQAMRPIKKMGGGMMQKPMGYSKGSKKPMGYMSGGMMKPMGYKHGTSVTASCKLGRNKPTKIT